MACGSVPRSDVYLGDPPREASSLTLGDVIGSLIAVVALYTVFLIVELYLMTKFVRLGPSSLHTGRYYFEQRGGIEK